jgi:hypothetical protein
MTQTHSRQIFISYAAEDEHFVTRLANDLIQSGAMIWLDILHALPGRQWTRSIQTALGESGMMIVVLSPEALESEHVNAEWQTYLEARRPVMPVIAEPCELPDRLRARGPIDFTRSYNYPRMFHNLMTQLIDRGTRLRRLDPVIWSMQEDVHERR